MLGYVRCVPAEMLVKHHSLYQALYCGLCHSIKKNVGPSLMPFLSYDFVFLAALRLYAIGEEMKTESQQCLLHPFSKRRKRIADNEALTYTAYLSLFLTYEKIRDDIVDKDTPFFRRVGERLYFPLLKGALKKVLRKRGDLAPLYESIKLQTEKGRNLEKNGGDLDALCGNFAGVLSQAFSFDLEGNEKRIMLGVGDYLGRFLYTLDAIDDAERDEKKGCYNPLLIQYGTATGVKEKLSDLDLVLSYYIQEIKLTFELLDGEKNLYALCDNIVSLGLTQAVQSVVKPCKGERE